MNCAIKSVTVAAAFAVVGVAQAEVRVWDWAAGDSGVSNNGGVFESIHAEYNTSNERLMWAITFSNQVTDGYTLALNDGPNPKGHAGELGLVYFDATDISNVRVTTYAYNGQNTQLSYVDGSPAVGTQAPDVVFASGAGRDRHPSVIQATAQDAGGKRVLTLEMDASFVNDHVPTYPGPGGVDDWFGIGFGEKLGVWLHPVKNLSTAYNDDGSLSHWGGSQGWLDGSNFDTVPTPGALAILAVGGGLVSRRRGK